PSIRMRPELGLCTPEIRLKKVLLPAPLGPMMALILHASNSTLTSCTAARPPNILVRFSTLSIVVHLAAWSNFAIGSRIVGAGRLGVLAQFPAEEGAGDAARHEDHQHHNKRAENDHPVV